MAGWVTSKSPPPPPFHCPGTPISSSSQCSPPHTVGCWRSLSPPTCRPPPSARPVKGECTCFSDVPAPRRARPLECAYRSDKTLAAFCRAQSRARVVNITLRRRSRFLHRRFASEQLCKSRGGEGGPIARENPCSNESVSFPQLSSAQHSTASAPVLLHPLCFELSQPNAGVDV